MARSWTEAQKSAIYDRGNTLLVSAAAGSGKTAVLTARILSKLTDREAPLDLSRLLVVTFTKAAAEELRERIAAALTDELSKDPGNKRLANQLLQLGSAKISTIHSFCYQLLRSHFDALGLSAGVRIGDAAEVKLLRKKIMNEVIDGYYEGTDEGDPYAIADFAAFSDLFITDRDDRLTELFLSLSDKLQSYSEGSEYLRHFAHELEDSADGFFDSRFGRGLLGMAAEELDYYERIFSDACAYFSPDEGFAKNYLPAFEAEWRFCHMLKQAMGRYDQGLTDLIDSHQPITLGRGVKKENQTAESDFYKDRRKDFAAYLQKLRGKVLPESEEVARESCLQTAAICRDLYRLIKRFETAMDEEKRRRGILDYQDLERLTLRLLYQNGVPSPIARELQDYYAEIYIDEYQDVNQVQDSIFRAIAGEDNLFMVGDIKQSIYGFRGAAPDIFAGYRTDYPLLGEGEGQKHTVFLSNNFRCDGPIIDFSNAIFSCLFPTSGRIGYTAADDLICSKQEGRTDAVPVTVALIEKDTDEEDGEMTEVDGEAEYVAGEIEKLLREGHRAGDIAILLRSAKTSAPRFEDALRRRGIPTENAAATDFFENAEVRLMLCLLCIIDNPMRDIELTGALMSPLYRFTLDDMITVRRYLPEVSLYEALERYTAEKDFLKGRYFLEKLEQYRAYADGQPVDKLIWYLYSDTGLLSFAGGQTGAEKAPTSPEEVRANLMLFYDHARSYESGSFKGLYQFIYYIEDIIADQNTIEQSKKGGEGDSVRIMTVHQSKGLEFPVCFLCDAGKKINKSDIKANMILDSDYGFAMMLRDDTGFARYSTPLRTASAMNLERKQMEEEMRVLYVALTRARERLYVTAGLKKAAEVAEECRIAASLPHPNLFLRQGCYIKWILTALAGREDIGEYCRILYPAPDTQADAAAVAAQGENTSRENADPAFLREVERYKAMFAERFAFLYPYMEATRTPAKLAVSGLYPRVLDEDEEGVLELFDGEIGEEITDEEAADTEPSALIPPMPRFMQDSVSEVTATAAERGTATHVCMQFCDFDYAEGHGVDAEIKRQTEQGFITEAMAGLIWRGQIAAFFRSPLYKAMRAADLRGELHREFRFNIKLPASDFTADEEKKAKLAGEYLLVQGVVDALFFDGDGYRIVDYKTDYAVRDPDGGITAASKMLADRHRLQLSYYKQACERITGRAVTGVSLYAFCLGEEIPLDL